MAILLAKGTKEIVIIDVADDTGSISDISILSPTYDFITDANVFIYTAAVATADGMQVSCLLDTSASGPSGLLAVGHYRLFIRFTIGTELPRLGPVDVFIRDTNS